MNLRTTILAGLALLLSASPVHAEDAAAPVLKDTVLLRNFIFFSGDRETAGASASFIDVNGRAYVLTAKHLLGDAMGIEPEVKPSRFDEALELWVVVHNDKFNDADAEPKPLAIVTGMHRPDDNMEFDLMVLRTDVPVKNVQKKILKIADAVPQTGDRVYMIGCPYPETSCLQKTYGATVTSFEDSFVIYDMDSPPASISGFSGAPLLNATGEIVAVVYGGDKAQGIATLVPDWLKQDAN